MEDGSDKEVLQLSLIINTNISSIGAYNILKANDTALGKTIRQLSTGLKITTAADNASGLAISERRRSQLSGIGKAMNNMQDAISMIQTAEGGLSQLHSTLQRMRELSIRAAGESLTALDRSYIQAEFVELRDQIDRIADMTQFNTKSLLNGDASALWSSDKLSTQAIVKGGLTSTDAFGQKVSAAGNYKIAITASPGQGEVQKSHILSLLEGGGAAESSTKLRDLAQFRDNLGNYLLEEPQVLTVIQGDGQQASVTLYGEETVEDLTAKLNDAIANGLGQGQYVESKDRNKFVTFVEEAGTGSESVPGTLLVRSAVTGETGRLFLAGGEELLKAFGLNTIQNSVESEYTVSISDAHSGKEILGDTKITKNRLIGVLNGNVDVVFDPMSGMTASWDDEAGAFRYAASETETVLHLEDATTTFQTGVNQGVELRMDIGDMRAAALGLAGAQVTDTASATRALELIDNAIDTVSMQRTRLAVSSSRLEHAMENLSVSGANLTAGESRIRDTDMAKTIVRFSQQMILNQTSTAMLAQANQTPQSVLALVR